MTVIAVHKDPVALTLTITAEFDASPERVWELWRDPRQLERWWGPPSYPATFTAYELAPGGHAEYHLTGPEGDRIFSNWDVVSVDPPRSIVIRDGAVTSDSSPSSDLAEGLDEMRVRIETVGDGRTRMSIENIFSSTEAMGRLVALGMPEGLREAVGQIDAILAEDAVVPV